MHGHRAGRQPRHIHHVLEKREQMPAAHSDPPDGVDLLPRHRAVETVLEHRAVPLDRAEWTPNVVRESRERAILRARRSLAHAEPSFHLETNPAAESTIF